MRQAIVTGGGTGIGKAVARAFADGGDKVVTTGRRTDVLAGTAAELGRGTRGATFDAADPAPSTAVRSAAANCPRRRR